jgi:ribonuclease-3
MKILERHNIRPKNKKIYEHAFWHPSYSNEQGLKEDYERLEFLGDAVLDLIISEYLYKNMYLEEGKMTKLRASYVCESSLAEYAMTLGFNEYIKVGKGEEAHGGKLRKTILADVFEAFLGALYLDLGLNKVRKFIMKEIIPIIEDEKQSFFIDYKSILQELMQTNNSNVTYELVKQIGPSHNRKFTVMVKVNNINYGIGTASSKKKAEQEAAKNALSKRVQ